MKGGDKSKVVYIPVIDNVMHWTNIVTGFRWSKNVEEDSTEYKTLKLPAFTDTGASCITGPPQEITFITDVILEKIAK
mgnify:CR=1 FL=1